MTLTDTDLSEYSKVWTTLITNTEYLPGLLTLAHSLEKSGSKYPLVALYTDTLSQEGHRALDARKIPKLKIEYLLPSLHKDYSNDPRFYDCWSKLQPFNLVQFEKVVQLDSDMVVLQNMDELFDIELGENCVFAASHACVCNPYNKPHYPKDWIAANCAYTHYHTAEGIEGPSCDTGLGLCNGGLQVVAPNRDHYNMINDAIADPNRTSSYDFADQSLLSDVFEKKWLPLSYKYNALKTLKNIHADIWDIGEVKNIHYILSPKPWNIEKAQREKHSDDTDTFKFWYALNDERLALEAASGISDGF